MQKKNTNQTAEKIHTLRRLPQTPVCTVSSEKSLDSLAARPSEEPLRSRVWLPSSRWTRAASGMAPIPEYAISTATHVSGSAAQAQ